MSVTQVPLPLRRGEDGPACGGDPMGAGEIGGGDEAFDLEEVGEGLNADREGDDGVLRAGGIEVDEGEHPAADGFVADPEDEVVAELHSLDDVRESEEEGSGALDVHAGSVEGLLLVL